MNDVPSLAIAMAVASALSLAAAAALGFVATRRLLASAQEERMLRYRVADELAQYRAFTRLLRDQGARVTTTTAEAAQAIMAGVQQMEVELSVLRRTAGTAPCEASVLMKLADRIEAPLLGVIGQLQFQDVTQQQLAFLSRLSQLVDQHMIELAQRLGDRRSVDRVGNFKEMFIKAIDECVMTSQREDQRAAVGLDIPEADGPRIELF